MPQAESPKAQWFFQSKPAQVFAWQCLTDRPTRPGEPFLLAGNHKGFQKLADNLEELASWRGKVEARNFTQPLITPTEGIAEALAYYRKAGAPLRGFHWYQSLKITVADKGEEPKADGTCLHILLTWDEATARAALLRSATFPHSFSQLFSTDEAKYGSAVMLASDWTGAD